MRTRLFSKWLVFIIASLVRFVQAQCISTFPALETFESGAVWTSGGANNDWAWGTPAHPTINGAGGGIKSWCVGGLSGSFYNFSEQCWIQSPCYNFSTLNYPWVSFKIFWECERQWDGMVLQSSINGGATWQNVGAFGDPVDCNTGNWFNYGNITWLNSLPAGQRHGWSGRIGPTSGTCGGGAGSIAWVVAKHCLTGLANQPNVIFRFLMGSGTTCNSYDGIAIDDFYISDGMAHAPNFSITCTGAGNFNFTAITPSCPVTSSYTWNFGDPGSGASNISSLANPVHIFSSAGIFSVTLTTAGGGCNPPGSVVHTINVTGVSNAAVSQSISCFGGTGNASVGVTPGQGPFVYVWSPSGGSGPVSTPLAAGAYSVSVSDGNGCTYIRTVTITQPPVLTAAISFSNISCNGANNGGATVTAGGGTPGYTYNWLPSGGTSSVATGLGVGSYTCTVTDNHGCTVTAAAGITQPAALTAALSSSNVSCNGGTNGSATVTAGGGSPGYTFSWLPSGGTSSMATGLGVGSYTCTITDNHGCTVTAVAGIGQPPALTATASSTNIACFGANNGAAMVNAGGGTPGYTYNWAPAGGTSSLAAGLSPGSYSVTITDSKGCSTVAVTSITQPSSALSASIAVQNAQCGIPNGGATVTASGGVPGYTYNWSPAGGTSSVASNLAAGNYSCSVTDNNGCVLTVSATVYQPVAISPVATVTNVSCFAGQNGAASLTVNGGTAPYNYTWSPSPGMGQGTGNTSGLSAQFYTVQISDAQLCSTVIIVPVTQPPLLTASVNVTNVSCNGANNGSAIVNANGGTPAYSYSWQPSGATSQSISFLTAGSYTVIVTDIKGCTVSAVGIVTQPAPLSLSLSVGNIQCFGLSNGSAAAVPSGGTPAYGYTWMPSGGNLQTASNLSAGNYTVMMKDANNCAATVTLSVTQPSAPLAAGISPANVLCFGNSSGAAQATVSGGTAPYSYSWSPGGGIASLAQNLSVGCYTVMVKDANSCAKSASIMISQPPQLQANVNPMKLCAGQSGILTASVSGGVGPYTYLWNNNAGASAITVSAAASMVYTLSVTDANGCSAPIDTAMVTIGGPLSLSVSPATTVCAGKSSSLAAIGAGGIGNYQYSWMPGNIQGPLINVAPVSTTAYTVTVGDGCTQPLAIRVTTVFVQGVSNSTIAADKYEGCAPLCVKLSDSLLDGVPLQNIAWNIGGATESGLQPVHCFTAAGTYTVSNIYSTGIGCVGSGTLNKVITVYPTPEADFTASAYTVGIFNSGVQFTNTSSGATSYLWDFGGLYQSYDANPSHVFSETGIYLVAMVAYNGSCSDTVYKVVECLPDFTFYAPNCFTPNNDDLNDRFLPKGEGWKPETYRLRVFDRWGEELFYTRRYDEGWDGRYKGILVKEDEYVWIVTLEDIFNKQHEYKGTILVLK